MTKGEAISQVRISLKALNADYRMPNKFVWGVIKKHMRWLIEREGNKFGIVRYPHLFQTLKCVNVEEAPAIDDCCGVKSRCTVFRTAVKIPRVFEDGAGAIIKSVFTIDGSQEFTQITVQQYIRKLENPNSKYDKSLYFYYNNGYLYFPNSKIRKVMIKAYFEDEVDTLNDCDSIVVDACRSRLDEDLRFPGGHEGELLTYVIKELAPSRSIPEDGQIDKNSTNIR